MCYFTIQTKAKHVHYKTLQKETTHQWVFEKDNKLVLVYFSMHASYNYRLFDTENEAKCLSSPPLHFEVVENGHHCGKVSLLLWIPLTSDHTLVHSDPSNKIIQQWRACVDICISIFIICVFEILFSLKKFKPCVIQLLNCYRKISKETSSKYFRSKGFGWLKSLAIPDYSTLFVVTLL